MKVWRRHVPLRFWFYKYNRAQLIQHGRYTPPCLSANFPFASYFASVCTLIIGLLLISRLQNMVVILEFPNGKSHPGRHEKCKLRSTEKCERSHIISEKTVIHYKRSQSQNVVVSFKTLPEINLLQA